MGMAHLHLQGLKSLGRTIICALTPPNGPGAERDQRRSQRGERGEKDGVGGP